MPVFDTSGFAKLPEAAISGRPCYFFGSMPTTTDDTRIQVTSVARTGGIATVVGTIISGNIPVTGNLVSIHGTTTGTGAFNVKSLAMTVVSTTAAGIITFTFTLAGTTSTTADAGMAIVPIAETAETLTAGATTQSVPIYVAAQEANEFGAKTITVSTIFPSLEASDGAATITLYTAANLNPIAPGTNGSEWTSMGAVATAAGGALTVGPLHTFTTPAGRFFCVVASSVTGSNTIVCKLLC